MNNILLILLLINLAVLMKNVGIKELYYGIPRITRYLILINIVCYALQKIVGSADAFIFYNPISGYRSFYLWQPITYMFLHSSFTHLFFNMWMLWISGSAVERALGEKRYLTLYMTCGIGAVFCHFLTFSQYGCLGASGAVMGLMAAFCLLYPNERIFFIMPPIPMKAKYALFAFIALDILLQLFVQDNIAHLAHLGGMLFGWLLITWWRSEARRPRTRKNKYENWHTADYDYNLEQRRRQERVDELLDKVRTSGYEGLTEEEKRELFTYTR